MKSTIFGLLALAIFAIGVTPATVSQAGQKKRKLVDSAFHEFDANRDKGLSESEFVGPRTGQAKESARREFKALDRDHDQSVTRLEFKDSRWSLWHSNAK